MTKKNTEPKVDRRKFIAGVAVAGAAGAVSAADVAKAATSSPAAAPSAVRPTVAEQAAETTGTPLVLGDGAGKPQRVAGERLYLDDGRAQVGHRLGVRSPHRASAVFDDGYIIKGAFGHFSLFTC